MMNPRFRQAAHRRRVVAFMLALLFHALLIASIAYAVDSEITDLLPDRVQEWLGLDNSQQDQPEEETAPSPTP